MEIYPYIRVGTFEPMRIFAFTLAFQNMSKIDSYIKSDNEVKTSIVVDTSQHSLHNNMAQKDKILNTKN